MDDRHFDDLTKLVGRRASRRSVIKAALAGVVATVFGSQVAEAALSPIKTRPRLCIQSGQPCAAPGADSSRGCCYKCNSSTHRCCEDVGYQCTRDSDCCVKVVDGKAVQPICRDPRAAGSDRRKACFLPGTLQSGAQCTQGGDCTSGNCASGVCQQCAVGTTACGLNCCNAAQCRTCVNGQCKSTCGPCQRCENGTCVNTCETCEQCRNNQCVPKCNAALCQTCNAQTGECSTCDGDKCRTCQNGQCVARCNLCQTCAPTTGVCSPKTCPTCQTCNPATGECTVPKACGSCQTCNRDTGACESTCAACQRCQNNICVDNCPTGDCQRCNPATGLCEYICDICDICEAGQCEFDCAWPMGGQNLSNTRYQAREATLTTNSVGNLAPRWVFTAGDDISATAAVVDGAVYFPDWAGNFYKLDAATGAVIWSRTIASYTGYPGGVPFFPSVSRTSPAVDNGTVYIGDQGTGAGTHLIAIDAATGNPRWITRIEDHPASIITQSPVVHNNVVYVGTASQEEQLAGFSPGYACCTFRGAVSAVNATTGAIIWTTYMTVPDYSGAAVWGSTPVVDAERGSLYVTTGNNYSVPQACRDDVNNCTPANFFDSVLAIDLATGAIKWVTRLEDFDVWTADCLFNNQAGNCPPRAGPNFDFGSGPNLITINGNGPTTQILGAGQKSGVYWAFDPDTGAILWGTQVGPGGTLGGIQWGSASDGDRIYVAISNNLNIPYTLPNGPTIDGGSWAALDPLTGQIIWQVADPSGAMDLAPVSVANGVVYVGSADSAGNFYALDATNGAMVWNYATGGSVLGGAAIVDGVVYWGSGYARLAPLTSSKKFYAFAIP